MKLLRDEKGHHSALKYPVEKFEWSPADCIASVWIPGSEDAPGEPRFSSSLEIFSRQS